MTEAEKDALVQRRLGEGKSWEDIADELKRKGYVSPRTKRPVAPGTLRTGSWRAKKLVLRADASEDLNVLTQVRKVIAREDEDAETKLRLIEILLEM